MSSLIRLSSAAPLSIVVGLGGRLSALDKGHADVFKMMGGTVRSSSAEDMTWIFVSALAFVIATAVGVYYYNRSQARKAVASEAPRREKETRTFVQLAESLGFKTTEIHNLKRIAARLSPKHPDTLLSHKPGREYLVKDLVRRVRRREREIDMLESMVGKLQRAAEGVQQSRDTVRVDADIPVWLVSKTQHDSVVDEGEELVNIEPVAGRLLDLSEGGAAVSADLPLSPGDRVEFWSADTQIWIPPIPAGVLDVEKRRSSVSVAHLHFLDPPLHEIRSAIRDIELSMQKAAADEAEQDA